MRVLNSRSIKLSTGTLDLVTEGDVGLDAFCDFAARANPKRGFLIVSRVLGRHLPASPVAMRDVMKKIAQKIPVDLPGPVVFFGMAETATALGQGVFAAYLASGQRHDIVYLQSSRQIVEGAECVASFEEGHSHATTHLIQLSDPGINDLVHAARTFVIVDDECSTGDTYVAVANAMMAIMPGLELVVSCCITDWSGKHYIHKMPFPTLTVSILEGSMQWKPSALLQNLPKLAAGSNVHGRAPGSGMRSRTGLRTPEKANRQNIEVKPGERILVLGEGEHSYEALLVAEEIEQKGGIAAVQCITRSPALVEAAMLSKSNFNDVYGSGAPCFLYNFLGHDPDRVLIVTETIADQLAEAKAALKALGASMLVETVLCNYVTGE